jgi:NADH-quinone oxidoreductase subunit G
MMEEDYFALTNIARTVFRTKDLDHRRTADPGAAAAERHAAANPMAVTYDDIETAAEILVVGLDAEQEVPILHLRLRKAARRGARIWVLHPRRTRLHDVATHVLCAPGDEARLLAGGADDALDEALAALREAGAGAVVLAGERPGAADAAKRAADATGARFQYVTRRANDRGALLAGVHPSLLPGGRSLDDADDVEAVWGPLMNREPGRDTLGILRACADREVDVVLLIGADPLRDVPDADLVRRALDNVPVKIVQSLELGSLAPFADAFLPASAFLEKDGHVSTWEGRGQRLRAIRGRDGISLADWEIFASMALACGGDLGFETLDQLHEEMGRVMVSREGSGSADDVGAPPVEVEPVEDEPVAAEPGEGAPDERLALFTYPLLVDEGRLSEGADELKAALGQDAFLELHPSDAAAAGITDGDVAVVRTDAGAAELPVRVTEHIAAGAAFVPFNQPGLAANTLFSGRMVTRADIASTQGDAAPTDDAEPIGAATGGEA